MKTISQYDCVQNISESFNFKLKKYIDKKIHFFESFRRVIYLFLTVFECTIWLPSISCFLSEHRLVMFLYPPLCEFLSITAQLYYTKYFICLSLTLEFQLQRLSAPFRCRYSSSIPLYLLSHGAMTHTVKQSFTLHLR